MNNVYRSLRYIKAVVDQEKLQIVPNTATVILDTVMDVFTILNSFFMNQDRYRKVPKFSDTRKLWSDLPKIQTKRPNLRFFCQKDANLIANSEDPDQTAPLGAV